MILPLAPLVIVSLLLDNHSGNCWLPDLSSTCTKIGDNAGQHQPPHQQQEPYNDNNNHMPILSKAACLLSYSFASNALEEALRKSSLPLHQFVNISGNLEQHWHDDSGEPFHSFPPSKATYKIQHDNSLSTTRSNVIVAQFLRGLSWAADTDEAPIQLDTAEGNTPNKHACQQRGLEIAYNLTRYCPQYILPGQSEFRPPKRSLIGATTTILWDATTIGSPSGNDKLQSLDIALLRDQQDSDHRFSMLFSSERKQGKKVARILAEIHNQQVYLRGMEVQTQRGQGYGSWILQVFCIFCLQCFHQAPQTRYMNKPLIAASLESLEFVPKDSRYLVEIAKTTEAKTAEALPRHKHNGQDNSEAANRRDAVGGNTDRTKREDENQPEIGTQVLMVRPVDPTLDLRPFYSKSFCRNQNIRLISPNGDDEDKEIEWRQCHVNSEFYHPNQEELERLLIERFHNYHRRVTFYSARTVAFLSSMDQALPLLMS